MTPSAVCTLTLHLRVGVTASLDEAVADVLNDYKVNGRSSVDAVERRTGCTVPIIRRRMEDRVP